MQKKSSKYMNNSIELVRTTVGYISETILEDFSFSAREGECVGLFGPNGAGKTTLLCAINGLARIMKGSVSIHGNLLTPFTGNNIRKKIGYVPQNFNIDRKIPILTEEVILMGRYGQIGLFRYPGKKDKELLDGLSKILEISHLLKKPFGQLSGGEKKKTLIARALIQEPEILLLDEIFSWLDWNMQKKMLPFIKKLHLEKKLTILIVSHNINFLKEICTRIVWMKKGRIVFDGSIETFLGEHDGYN